MDIEILKDLGLTGAEVKVFLSLLEIGSTSAGKVVERSGLQNAVVHRAFHSLAKKGLITNVTVGRKKHYQAVSPKQLLNYIDRKKERLESILPELEAKRQLAKEKPQATMFQGKRGVRELVMSMIETKSKHYFAYGGPQRAHDLLGDYLWESFHRKRIKKKINAKLIFHSSVSWWGKELTKLGYTQVKTTRKDFEELTETIICGEKVAIIIYTEKPFGFLIESSEAAAAYQKFFELLWKSSK